MTYVYLSIITNHLNIQPKFCGIIPNNIQPSIDNHESCWNTSCTIIIKRIHLKSNFARSDWRSLLKPIVFIEMTGNIVMLLSQGVMGGFSSLVVGVMVI